MMMAPMLYTDVTDAWRLRVRRQRLIIAGAGIMVELGLACVALFVWAFLPDGSLRSIAFILAVVSLAASLAINLNPLMRFDGYYLLADWLGVENLQSRAFDLALWKLREWLFGLCIPCSEQLPHKLRVILIFYAWVVWIYRLLLFVGIALVVYFYFFKLLGIALFLFEIGYFIMRPLWSELRAWHDMRRAIFRSRRSWFSVFAVFAVVLAAVTPWSTRVEIPAILEPSSLVRIFPVRAARIVAMPVFQGETVTAGQALIIW